MRNSPIAALENVGAYLWEFWTTAPALSWVMVGGALVGAVILWHTDTDTGTDQNKIHSDQREENRS